MAISTASLVKLWARDFDEIMFDNYVKVPAQGIDFLNDVDAPDKHFVKKGLLVTIGAPQTINEGAATPMDQFLDGPAKTVYPSKAGIALQATMEALQDDRQGILKQAMAKIGESMKYGIELRQWDILNSGFSSSVRVGLDSKALFATNHQSFGQPGVTFDNTVTGALSKSTLQAAIVKFTNLQDERGKPVILLPKMLFIPPALEWKAKELLLSEYDPETGNNAINALQGRVQYMIVRYFTSTTAWFVGADKSDLDIWTYWFDRIRSKTIEDGNTDNMIFKATMRLVATFFNWRGVVGSTGV